MLNLHFTLADTLNRLIAVVDKFGADHTARSDNGCFYASQDEQGFLVASCIVGQWFASLGLLGLLVGVETGNSIYSGRPVDTNDGDIGWGEREGRVCNLSAFNEDEVAHLASLGVTFDEASVALLRRAQAEQDMGTAWGEAVEEAADAVIRMGLVEVKPLIDNRTSAQKILESV